MVDNQKKARALVVGYYNERKEKTDEGRLSVDDTFVVWFCYILGGWKALISTTVVDGMYYEVTYNKNQGVTYIDAYKKWENVSIPDNEFISDVELF